MIKKALVPKFASIFWKRHFYICKFLSNNSYVQVLKLLEETYKILLIHCSSIGRDFDGCINCQSAYDRTMKPFFFRFRIFPQ